RRRTIAGGKSVQSTKLLHLTFMLPQAEPVPGVVFENRFNPIELLLGWSNELDAFCLEILVGGLAIQRIKNAGSEDPFLDKLPQRVCRLFVKHEARPGFHQCDLEPWLVLRANRYPPAVIAHRGIGADFETQLVPIELEGFLLVEYVDCNV